MVLLVSGVVWGLAVVTIGASAGEEEEDAVA